MNIRRFFHLSASMWLASVQSLALVLVFSGLWWGAFALDASTAAFLDKTQAQQWADERLLSQQKMAACQAAGGDWVVSFFNAGCTRAYTADISWYVPPTENPLKPWTDNLTVLAFVAWIVVALLGPLYIMVESHEQKLENKHQQWIAGLGIA